MIDDRFFKKALNKSVSEIAVAAGIAIQNNKIISGVASLLNASENDLSFLSNPKYVTDLAKTKAGAVFIEKQYIKFVPTDCIALITANPLLAYAKAVSVLYPDEEIKEQKHISSVIDSSAKIGKGCNIGPFVYIQENAEIGEKTVIESNTIIGKGVVIGNNCKIGSNVTITHSLIGDRVIIHSGAVIGEAGFGIIPDKQGMLIIKQLGKVIIKNNVRIGANTTIDRGSVENTVIGANTIIDNLVQIGHNVHIGERCILVSQVGLSGSCSIGNESVLAGKAGVAGHIHIGNNVTIAAKAGVTRDIPDGSVVAGFPAMEINTWKRQIAALRKLAKRNQHVA